MWEAEGGSFNRTLEEHMKESKIAESLKSYLDIV